MVRAVPGGTVTTTRGQGDVGFDAPAAQSTDSPVGPTIDPTAEGDDIEVLPEPAQLAARRLRALAVGGVVVLLAAAAVTVGVINHRHSGTNRLNTLSVDARSPKPKPHVAPKHPLVQPHAKPHHNTATSVAVVAPTTAAAVTHTTLPAVAPSTAPPVTAPPVESPSVLTWQSSPATLDLTPGAHLTFSVTVSNPTDGTVTLGVPLSCAPTLETAHGAAISNVMCEQIAQVLSPRQTLTQQYTVYATSTGDATGTPLAAGRYIVRVENLYSIPVTVTAS